MKKTNSEARNVVEARLEVGMLAELWKNVRGRYRQLYGNGTVTVGLGPNGASDLIGYISETVDDTWIARNRGKKVARFSAIEMKADDDNTEPEHLERQAEFIATIEKAGGYAGFARSGDDVKKILRIN